MFYLKTTVTRLIMLFGLTFPVFAGPAGYEYAGEWGSFGTGDGEFIWPGDVAVSSGGTVFVADIGNNRIQYFTSTGSFLGKWGSAGKGPGDFFHTYALALAPNGSVYVLDSPDEYPSPKEDAVERVQCFSPSGSFIVSWRASIPEIGNFGPFDIAVDAAGVVYLPDIYRGRVLLFSSRGEFIKIWTPRGSGPGEFDNPVFLIFGPEGRFYVGESSEGRIQYFTNEGEFLGMWGSFGTSNGEFYYPSDIAVATDGTIFVTDNYNRVQYFGPSGEYLGGFGSPGIGPGEFHSPSGVAVGPDGLVYVADTQNHRMQFFRPCEEGGEKR